VLIVMGSRSDEEHARAIAAALEPYEVAVLMRVLSAHKVPEAIPAWPPPSTPPWSRAR